MMRSKILWLTASVSLVGLVATQAASDPVTWIRDNTIVFETSEPNSGFEDLLRRRPDRGTR